MKIAGIVLVVIVWILLFFVGYFFASSIYLPIVAIILSVGIFYFFKSSGKLAIILSVVTLVVCLCVIATGFEEDYCWGKGEEADPSGSKMVVVTKEDTKGLSAFDVKEGTKIGVSFRTHMLCHNTFNFAEVLRENYSFIK